METQEKHHRIGAHSSDEARGPVLFPELTGEELAWFAVYVQVKHEKEVAKRLSQKSIECFLPLAERWSKRRDRRKKIHTPIFPGYVFVNTVLDNYTNLDILKTPGVVFLLKNSAGVVPIPDHQINSLKAMLNKPDQLVVHSYLKEGDWVEVVRGPLAGCMGILLRQDPKKGRLVVNVDIIKQAVSVELDMEDVQRIEAPPRFV